MAVAEAFLQQHVRVALLDWDAPELQRTHDRLAQAHGANRVLQLVADVGNPTQMADAVAQLSQRWGRLDALVNNAGVAIFKPITQTTFEEWQAVMSSNLNGPFIGTQVCTPLLVQDGGGAVVNIASISGLRASTLRVAYGTSKAALIHLTRQQAVELGNAGVRVNAVAPGPVDTAMAKLVHTPAIRADYHDTIPLNRYGTPEEIAQAVLFLCSPAASYVNGQVLAADGGFDAAGVGLPTLRREG